MTQNWPFWTVYMLQDAASVLDFTQKTTAFEVSHS